MHRVDMRIVEAVNLKEVKAFGTSTPHVVILCNEKEVGKSPKAEKTLNPKFDFRHSFEVAAPPHQHVVKIRILSSKQEMGNCELPLGQVLHMKGLDEILDHNMSLDCKGKSQGEVRFRICIRGEGDTGRSTPARSESMPVGRASSQSSIASTPRQDSPAPGTPRTPRPIDPAFRARVVAFYECYEPSKLQGVDAILQKHGGDPEGLMTRLVAKYGAEPQKGDLLDTAPGASPAASPAQSPSPAASPSPSPTPPSPRSPREVDSEARARVMRFYQHHEPAKVGNVDSLLQKYDPDELMQRLVERYGPEPEPEGGGAESAEGSAPATPREGRDELHARVVRFYEYYSPEKVNQVDAIIAKPGRTPQELLAALVERYGPEPTEQDMQQARDSGSPAQAPSPTSTQHSSPKAMRSQEEYLHVISKYYKKHDPPKLQVVKVLLEKTYQGDGAAMLKALTRKWGEEPESEEDEEDSPDGEGAFEEQAENTARHQPETLSPAEVAEAEAAPGPAAEQDQGATESEPEPEPEPEAEAEPEAEVSDIDTGDADAGIAELKEVIAKQREQLNQCKLKFEEMQAEHKELVRSLKEARNAPSDAQSVGEAVLEAVTPVKLELDQVQRSLDAKELLLEEAQSELQALRQGASTEEPSALQIEIDQKDEELQHLQSETSMLNARIEELVEAASDTELALSQSNERCEELQGSVNMLEQQLAAGQGSPDDAIQALRDTNETLQLEVAQLGVQVQEKDEELRMQEELMSSRLREAEERLNTVRDTKGEERTIEKQERQGEPVSPPQQDARLVEREQELLQLQEKLDYQTGLIAAREEEVKVRGAELEEREELLQYREAQDGQQGKPRSNSKATRKEAEQQKRLSATQQQMANQTQRIRDKEQELADKEAALSCREEELKIQTLELEKQRLTAEAEPAQPAAGGGDSAALDELREKFADEVAAGAELRSSLADKETQLGGLAKQVEALERLRDVLEEERSTLVEQKTELQVANNLLTQEKVQTDDRLAHIEHLETKQKSEAHDLQQAREQQDTLAEKEAVVQQQALELEALRTDLRQREEELAALADTPKGLADEAVRLAAAKAELDQREEAVQAGELAHAESLQRLKELEAAEGVDALRAKQAERLEQLRQADSDIAAKEASLELRALGLDAQVKELTTTEEELLDRTGRLDEQENAMQKRRVSLEEFAKREEEFVRREADVEEREILTRQSASESIRRSQMLTDQEENLKFREDELQVATRDLDRREAHYTAAVEREAELRQRSDEMRALLETVRKRALLLDDREHAITCREETLDTTGRRLELRATQLKEQEHKLQLLGSVSHAPRQPRDAAHMLPREREVTHNRKDDIARRREKEMQQALTLKDKQLHHMTQQLSRADQRRRPKRALHASEQHSASPSQVRVTLDLDADVGPPYMKGTASSQRRSVSSGRRQGSAPPSPRLSLETAVQSLTCTLGTYEDFLD